jgi:hypothetical protein
VCHFLSETAVVKYPVVEMLLCVKNVTETASGAPRQNRDVGNARNFVFPENFQTKTTRALPAHKSGTEASELQRE